jgi:predicted dehydrogenase
MTREKQSPQESSPGASRRQFLQWGTAAAAASSLANVAIPRVHAAEDNTIRLALIGCGGRGSGAVGNAMNSSHGPVQLYAMADVAEDRLARAHKALADRFGERVNVPKERQFVGFDAYKKAIDCLGPKDVAMLTSFAYVRPLQLEYAVRKGVNVFMEKSFAPDAPNLRRMLQAGEEAKKKNLKIMAGLQCRHSVNRQELIKRIRDGQLGEIMLVRAYRVHPAGGGLGKRSENMTELMWQIRNFTSFQWVSGGLYAEMNIHQIDELVWLKGDLPAVARGIGGRARDTRDRGQEFDSISIEWTFPDGTKATDAARWLGGHCYREFATYVHGTKCAAQFSGDIHAGTTRIYKDQRCANDNIVWEAPREQYNPWDAEWNVLLENIRKDQPQNEVERAVQSNFADLMGRAAVHSGMEVTWEQMTTSNFQFYPGKIDDLNYDSEPPVKPDADGYYPVPVPGVTKET